MLNHETPPQKARRLAMNTWIRCLGLSKKSQLVLRQKVKEIELKECKKTFGMTYLDLVERSATAEDLQACIDHAKRKVAEISLSISELKVDVKRAEDETKSKIAEGPFRPSTTPGTVKAVSSDDIEIDSNEEYIVVDGTS